MNKIVFVLLVFNVNVNCFSQEIINEEELPRLKKFHLGFNFSTDVCYRTLKTNDTGQVMQYIIESRNGYEIIKIGYNVGANVYYDYSRHLAFETGIRYSNCGYGTEPIDISSFSASVDIPDFLRTIDGFHYVEAPIKFILKRGDRKLDFFMHASIIPALLISATDRSISTFPDGHKEREMSKSNYDFKHFNLFSSAGIGMVYHFDNYSQIRIEPSFKFGFLSIIDAGIDGYLWNSGINVSYYF